MMRLKDIKGIAKTTAILLAVIVIIIAAVGVYYVVYYEPAPSAPEFKIAGLFSYSAYDGGYNEMSLRGLNATSHACDAKFAFSDHVTLADLRSVITTYADEKYDFITVHISGGPYWDILKDFPNMYFTCDLQPVPPEVPNAVGIYLWPHEIGYLIGMLSAYMTETGTVAIMLAYSTDTQLASLHGFQAGAAAVNPNVTVLYSYTGSWSEETKGYEAVSSYLEQGADIVYLTTGGAPGWGGLEAILDRGVGYGIGGSGGDWWLTYTDQHPEWKEILMTSGAWNFTKEYERFVEDAMLGTWEGGRTYDLGLKDGVFYLAPFRGKFATLVPQEVQDAIADATEDIIAGEIKVPLIPTL